MRKKKLKKEIARLKEQLAIARQKECEALDNFLRMKNRNREIIQSNDAFRAELRLFLEELYVEKDNG